MGRLISFISFLILVLLAAVNVQAQSLNRGADPGNGDGCTGRGGTWRGGVGN